MATASEILSAIAPHFDDVSGRSVLLGQAESRTSSTFFGANRPDAVAYMAAHLLDMSASAAVSSGASGPISSKKEGDLAVSFASSGSSSSASGLSQTRYGQMLLDLMRSSGPAAGVTGQPYCPALFVPGRGFAA